MTDIQTQDFVNSTREFMYFVMGDSEFINYLSNKFFVFDFQLNSTYILSKYAESKHEDDYNSTILLVKNLRKWLIHTRKQLKKQDLPDTQKIEKELEAFELLISVYQKTIKNKYN